MKKLSLSVLVLSFVSLSALAQTAEQRGINTVNNGVPNRISMNVITSKQTPNQSFGEKLNAGLHAEGNVVASGSSMAEAPGQPIGGIVVKGGQNPTQAVTEDHRTYTSGRFNTIKDNTNDATRPGNPIGGIVVKGGTPAISSDKSINENGVKRAGATVAVTGEPIGGIVVKGGEN